MAKKHASSGTPATVALDRAGVAYKVRAYHHDPAAPSFGLEAAEASTELGFAIGGGEVAGALSAVGLTDADIAHAPDTLRTLVTRAVAEERVLVSLMARLRCESLAERALIPAFVWFFQMLYPFAAVNRRGSGRGAAAGGVMLVEGQALQAAGGIAAVRSALIDDCAFGALMKTQGPVWLGLTDRATSIRRYDSWDSVAQMISRSALSPCLIIDATSKEPAPPGPPDR